MSSERTFGVEIEMGTDLDPWEIDKLLNREFPEYAGSWESYEDGTAVETHTPPLKGDQGHLLLKDIFQVLKDKANAYVTSEDGMHVHFGAEDMVQDKAILARVVRSWVNTEHAISQFIRPMRRGGYWACYDFNSFRHAPEVPQEIRKIKKLSRGASWEERNRDGQKLNAGRRKLCIDHVIAALRFEEEYYRTPTIEVRAHEGTLDFEDASAWIKMLTTFLDYHQDHASLPSIKRPETLLERLGVDSAVGDVLMRKTDKFRQPQWYEDGFYDDEPDYEDDGYAW